MQDEKQSKCAAVLRAEFAARSSRNSRYSLRAFARDLRVPPSSLCELLSGKHGISSDKALALAERLGYSETDARHFRDLAESEFGRSEVTRGAARQRVERQSAVAQVNQIALDSFEMISHWYHLGIIELLQTKAADSGPVALARRLGIGLYEAKLAVARLLRLGLIQKKGRSLVPTHGRNQVGQGVPSEAIRNFHRQLLNKALDALDRQTIAERTMSSTIIAIPQDAFPEALALITEFRRRFNELMAKAGPKERLHCLSIQFYRLEEEGPHV